MHNDVFPAWNRKLAELDKAMAGLIQDLDERGLLEDTVVLWMGEFGRTRASTAPPAATTGPAVGASSSGGSGIKGGQPSVGATNEDGTEVDDRALQVRRPDGLGPEGARASRWKPPSPAKTTAR